MPRRAAIYCYTPRAGAATAADALAHQEQVCRGYARRLGIDGTLALYADTGRDRGALKLLADDIETGHVNAVIVADVGCVNRDERKLADFLALCRRCDTTVWDAWAATERTGTPRAAAAARPGRAAYQHVHSLVDQLAPAQLADAHAHLARLVGGTAGARPGR
jgi:hypothetical protein